MKILLIGDIVGEPGRKAIGDLVPRLRENHQLEYIIANGENAAGGNGLTPKIAEQLFSYGVDVITSGDHIWKNKEVLKVLDLEPRILRPANYPAGAPGKGYQVLQTPGGLKVGIINLLGRVFISTIDCPFRAVDHILNEISRDTKIIIVDFHAEATSEKIAMGWHLDGRVSCLAGTHTHVPTRDSRILPGGTAYITDLGMVGSRNSVIGVSKEAVLKRFLTQLPQRFQPAKDDMLLSGIIVTIDPETGKASEIVPIDETWP